MCLSVRWIPSRFKKSSWKTGSFLPSVLGLEELWLIRTTLLFICLTCGNICNLFLVRNFSKDLVWLSNPHCQWKPASWAQRSVGGQAKVFYPPPQSPKHQHLLEVRLKRSCWNSGTETQFQPGRGSDVWYIMRAGDCPLLHIIIIHIMKGNEMVQADNSCFYSAFQRFSSTTWSRGFYLKGEHPIVNIGAMRSHDVSNEMYKAACVFWKAN